MNKVLYYLMNQPAIKRVCGRSTLFIYSPAYDELKIDDGSKEEGPIHGSY